MLAKGKEVGPEPSAILLGRGTRAGLTGSLEPALGKAPHKAEVSTRKCLAKLGTERLDWVPSRRAC